MRIFKRLVSLLLCLSILAGFACVPALAATQVFTPLLEDSFTTLSDAWTTDETRPEIATTPSYLEFSHTSGTGSANGIMTKTNVLSGLSSYTVSFRAKINQSNNGPHDSTGDLNTFGVQLLPQDGSRFMFSLDKEHIHTSKSNGTWANEIAYPSGFRTTDWHTYKLVATAKGTVEIYADDTKLGEGAFQTTTNGTGSGLKLYVSGSASAPANSYLENVSITSGSDTKLSDTFATLDKTVWTDDAGTEVRYPTLVSGSKVLHLSDSAYKNNGVMHTIDYQGITDFTVTFDAKVNSLTGGPGGSGSNNDCNSLGLQIFANGGRFALSLEKDNIRATNGGSTWGKTFSWPSGKACTDWHTYKISVSAQTATIYVDDAEVGSVSGFTSNSGNAIKFFVRGNSSASADAWVKNLKVGYYVDKNLPTWSSDAKLAATPTTDGFTLSWPAASNATSYDVKIGTADAVSVTDTTYTATGLTRTDAGYTVTITAKNTDGSSATSLTGTANVKFDFASNTKDDQLAVASKTAGNSASKYGTYRIPGIITTSNDTLIMYYEARQGGGDWDPMDIVAFRSTDQGETWSDAILIVPGLDDGIVCNNPIMIPDKNGVVHLLYCVEYGTCNVCKAAAKSTCTHSNGGVFYCKSTDDGVTWSTPENISDSCRPDDHVVIATGPGHGIRMTNGTLLTAVWLVKAEDNTTPSNFKSHHPGNVSTLYSLDGGETWQLGDIVPNNSDEPVADPNETVAVETEDGGVMLNIRSGGGGYRALAYSANGYSGWTNMAYHKDLIDPTCFGSTAKYDIAGTDFTTLMVNCESPAPGGWGTRQNLTVKGSLDGGQTWPIRKVLVPGSAGYSDMTVDSKGNIYVLYEVDAGVTDRLARFSYAWLAGDLNAQLTGLTVDGAADSFTFSGDDSYVLSAAPGSTLSLVATARSASATITINGTAYTAGETYRHVYTTASNTITIVVTYGEVSKTYTLTIKPKAPANSMVLYLNGESWNDQTIYDNDPTHSKTTIDSATFKYGTGSYTFDGNNVTNNKTANAHLDVSPTNGMAMATDNFTVSAWVYPSNLTDQHILFWYGGAVAGAAQWWCRTNGTNLQFCVGSDGTETTLTATGVLKLNEWQHVAVVRDGTKYYIYRNGEKVAEETSASVRNVSGDDGLTIGTARNASNPRTFKGNMDEIMIFNYALTADQITSVMGNDLLWGTESKMTAFSIGTNVGTISGTNVSVTVDALADLTSLTPTITVSDHALVSPASGIAQDFTSPVTYTVTAENGTSTAYTVTVTKSSVHAHTPTHVAAKAATYSAPGNIEYWYCASCGKYFSDSACQAEISLADTVLPQLTAPTTTPSQAGTPAQQPFNQSAAASSFPFADVDANSWYYGSVYTAWSKGLIDGVSASAFKPNASITVAQTIKLAAALHQLQHTGKVTLTNGTPWYSTYLDYAIANGILDAKYRSYTAEQLNAAAARGEFVHILHGAMENYASLVDVADNAIPDVKTTDTYGAEIYEFYRAGILTGSDANGTFYPDNNIKRSEVATILVRMFQS